jgi:hypothetical protein
VHTLSRGKANDAEMCKSKVLKGRRRQDTDWQKLLAKDHCYPKYAKNSKLNN